ncbi:MAG: hypothetical protein AB1705_00450 [Verrucomicrobiota bacterium]
MLLAVAAHAQTRGSLAGEEAAAALKRALAAEDYNLQWGAVRFRTEAAMRLGYTDNVFFSDANQSDDLLINPGVNLQALWPVTELNALRLSLGVNYEWYLNNRALNSDAPLINPDSELSFRVFAGDFRITLRERFSYQESLFYNSGPTERFFNFVNVGKFSRWDNLAGLEVLWDLNKVVLTAGYDHENFVPVTGQFNYLDRVSEWFNASAALLIGDTVQVGLEAQASLHDYATELVLNDHWRARGGPFIELLTLEKINLRAGGGYETARFRAGPAVTSEFEDYYAYVRVQQETRLFTHALAATREHLIGDNANNVELTQVRYSIASPVVRNVHLGASLSANFAEEFGGPFREEYTYYRAGVWAGWQFHKHWRTGVAYDFSIKESDVPLRDFSRNRLSWELSFSF